MRSIYLTSLLLVLTALGSTATRADTEHSLRLTEFWGGDASHRLAGQSANLTLSVPLSEASAVRESALELYATHSAALLPRRSLIGVRFNNATIAQVPVESGQPSLFYPADIPTELWRKGFNTLEFFVAQHAVEQCEDGEAPELWTELDLYRSRLNVTTRDDYELRLRSLKGLYDPGIGAQQRGLLIAATSPDSAVYREALPLAAQALALRRRYRTLDILLREPVPVPDGLQAFAPGTTADPDTAVAVDLRSTAFYLGEASADFHLLIGTREALAPYLPDDRLDAIDGPYLTMDETAPALIGQVPVTDADSLQPLPARRRLIISGETPADVVAAAQSLGLMREHLIGSDTLEVTSLGDEPDDPDPLAATALQPGDTYRLSALGVSSRSFRGAGQFTTNVPLLLPADYYVDESEDAYLYLDFGYGADFGPSSALNVFVNGEIIGGITLDNPNGQAFYRYRLTVPARMLRGGSNELRIEANLRAPLSTEACARPSDRHLALHLRGTSFIALPEAARLAAQPDLELLARTAYPLTGLADGATAPVQISRPATAGTALTLIGRLAQSAGVPLPHLQLQLVDAPSLDAPASIALAPREDLPEALFDDLEVALGRSQRVPLQLQNTAYNSINRFLYNDGRRPLHPNGSLAFQAGLGDLALLYASRNENGESPGTRFLITADSESVLETRVRQLTRPRLWGQLSGDFFVWSDAADAELVMKVSPGFQLAPEASRMLQLRLWLSNNPWYWLIAVLVVIALTSLVTYRLLARRHARIAEDW